MRLRYTFILQNSALLALFWLSSLLAGQVGNNTEAEVSNERSNSTFVPAGFQTEVSGDNSSNCNLTVTGGNITCDNGGTPNDPSDDTFFQSVFVENDGATGSWSSNSPDNASGNYGQLVTLGFYPASGGDVTFTITDDNDPSCTATYTVANPCDDICNITDVLVLGPNCGDNGTPNDVSDDVIIFSFSPQGQGLDNGAYSLATSIGTPSNNTGIYGSYFQFVLPAAGAPATFTVTITDSQDPNCTFSLTLDNPCFSNCDLTNPGLGFTICNDNGTPNDPSDDFYTFPLNPVGTGLGGGYTVSVSGGTLSPPGGNYGSETTFTLTDIAPPAGISVIVTDNDDPNCITNTIINIPPPCSSGPPCELTQSTIVTNECINGNPVFELLADGTGTGSNYTVSVTEGTISGNNAGNYGQITAFTIIPDNANVSQFTITITDANDPTCTATITITNPCPTCTITSSGLSNEDCNDNGTPNDPSDDFAVFTITVNGVGTSGGYTVSSSEGPVSPPIGTYNTAQTFSLPQGSAGNGPTTITLTDNQDPGCTFSFAIVNQNVCSSVCTITPILNDITCDDNGTPGNPGDDVFFANVTVNGTGGPSGWTVFPVFGPGIGTYGTTVDFGPIPISGGPVTLTFTDQNEPTCSADLTLTPPAPCSTELCSIDPPTVITSICDNGTINFELLVDGTGTGSNYQIATPDGVFTPSTLGNYGQITAFTLLPDDLSVNNYTLTISDINDPTCTTTVILDNPCETCSITVAALSDVQCQNNNSPEDPADDFISFTLLVDGVSTSGAYLVTAPGQILQPTSGNFGTPSTFSLLPGSAGGGPIALTITDANDNSCTTTIQLSDPGTCSDACEINAQLIETICIATGVPADDFFQVTIQVFNPVSTSGWSTQTPLGPVSDDYNQNVDIGPFLISQGDFTLTFTDQNNPNCSTILPINAPDPCSVDCDSDTTLIDLQSCNPGDVGTVVQNLTGQNGCDSVVITTTTLLPSDTTLLTETSCNPLDTGTVVLNLANQFGCDSTVILNTLLVDSDTTLIDLQSCNPGDAGIVVQNLTGQIGCDSVVITTTTLLPSDTTLLTETSCNPLDTGTVVLNLANQFGCDSTVILNTLLIDSDTTLIDLQSCNLGDAGTVVQNLTGQVGCDSVVITTTTLLPSDSTLLFSESCNPLDTGTVVLNLANQFGCDSTVILNTLLIDSDTTLIDLQSCNPGDAGTVVQNLTGQNGCDSVVITTTTLLPSDTTLLTETSCNPLDTGTVVLNLANQFGCDSTVILNTLLVDSDTTLIDLQSCNPGDAGTIVQNLTGQIGCDSVVITTTTLLPSDSTLLFSESCNPLDTGTVVLNLANQFGCDSTVILNTLLIDSDTTLIDLQSCNPGDAGTVVQNLTGQIGCDSVVITTTTLLPSDTTLLTETSCNPLDTGTVVLNLANQFGCDSTVILNTLLIDSDTTLIDLQSCNPGDAGTIVQNLTGQVGCDSVVITTTTLLPSDTTLLTETSCNPLDTGTVVLNLANQFGCDSTVILNTLLIDSNTTLIDLQSCNPGDAGTIVQNLTGQVGCDSVVITTTTLLPSDSTLLTETSCNPLDTGTVVLNLDNQFGCDSTVITTTTLLPSDTTRLFSESCNPLDTGTVVLNLANQFGCDSTVITTTTLLPSDTTLLFSESCNPLDTGTVVLNLANQFGCDSTVITTTTLLPSDSTLLFSESCNPLDTGTVVLNLANQFGCDSTVITTTTLLPSDITLFFSESCNPLDTGTVVLNLANQFGCDSTVITTTMLLPSDSTLLFSESCNPLDTGTVVLNLANQFGCDSTVITTTTLLPSDSTLLFSESCNPLDTGTVVLNLANQFGCDSTVITTTTLLPSDTTLFFSESCNPLDTGTVVLNLANQFGCDSTVITQIQLQNNPDFELITDTLCAGEFVTINGTVYDEERPIGQEVIQSAANGCDSVIIDIVLSFSDLETSINTTAPPCAGLTGEVQIGIPENGFSPYRIFVNGAPVVSSSPLPLSLEVVAGIYTITVEDQLGCSEARQVTVPEGPVPELTLDSPINAQAGDTLVLAPVLNFLPDQLLWTPASQLSCTDCLNPTLTVSESGTYQLIAGIGGGCEVRATVQVIVDQRSNVYTPNVFSPNDDGRNDWFTLFGDPAEIDFIEQLGIYDRWGNQVFFKTAFPVNVEAEGWDGTFRGQPMDPAVFTYYAKLRLTSGRQLIQQGDVTLIR